MNRDDAKRLLAHCAAFDNRQPSLAAAEAWAAALHDVPADDDAFAAVARYYATPPRRPGDRLWIQPHDIRVGRQQLRAERLENFTYEPPTSDCDPHYLARLRGQLAATADGRRPAPGAAPALESGPHPRFVKELEARGYRVGRPVPDAEEDGSTMAEVTAIRRPGPLGVECPVCRAPIGRPCKTRLRSKNSPKPHGARRRVAAGRPAATETPAEIEKRRAAALAHLAQTAHQEDQS